jgi:hypothetical protein
MTVRTKRKTQSRAANAVNLSQFVPASLRRLPDIRRDIPRLAKDTKATINRHKIGRALCANMSETTAS